MTAPANPSPSEGAVAPPATPPTDTWDSYAPEGGWPREWIPRFLSAYAGLGNITDAARVAGIDPTTVKRAWRGGREAKFEYAVDGLAEAIEEARERSVDYLERVALQVASERGLPYTETRTHRKLDGEGKVIEETTVTTEGSHRSNGILMRLLEANRPDKYARRTAVQHSAPGGGPVVVQVQIERRPTRERMLELAALARQHEIGPMVIDGEAVEVDPPNNGSLP